MAATRRRLNRARTLRLLDELEGEVGAATSLYVPPNSPVADVRKLLEIGLDSADAVSLVSEEIARSRTGAVLYWGEQQKCLIAPPFPVGERLVSNGYDVVALRSLLQRDVMLALILVRLGAYAVGVFRGENLISSKVGTGLVHSRHKKGGSSQRRFERGREKQIESFFDRVCARTRERLEPYLGQLDYVVYGGERHTVLSFRKRCQFLQHLDDVTLSSLLNVREPRQATLEEAITQAWASEVVRWHQT